MALGKVEKRSDNLRADDRFKKSVRLVNQHAIHKLAQAILVNVQIDDILNGRRSGQRPKENPSEWNGTQVIVEFRQVANSI